MKFFVDTADVEEIRAAKAMGLADGVTTNPSLLARTGRSLEEVVKEIAGIVEGPISAEVVATETEGMLREARIVAEWAPNVVVKIPCTEAGLAACRTLADEEIDVNLTLVFSPLQALLAARAGARFVSPFVGRLDDHGENGIEMVKDIATIYDNYGFETEILVASCRTPIHVLEAALLGADVATCPLVLLKQIAKHPLTDVGLARFLADSARTPPSKGLSKG